MLLIDYIIILITFSWYQESSVCYVHLSDVVSDHVDDLLPQSAWPHTETHQCRWFTRGWTLQELIAPRKMEFFTLHWTRIGNKSDMISPLSRITGIPETVLRNSDPFGYSTAQRMSWAANRQTTRVEDLAYCLLGIFDIYMPLLYGEGERAFVRLQQEIVKVTDDESIFAWKSKDNNVFSWRSLFAQSPSEFEHAAYIVPATTDRRKSHETTASGLVRVWLPLISPSYPPQLPKVSLQGPSVSDDLSMRIDGTDANECLAILNCQDISFLGQCIVLKLRKVGQDEYLRIDAHKVVSNLRNHWFKDIEESLVLVRQRLDYSPWLRLHPGCRISAMIVDPRPWYGHDPVLLNYWTYQDQILPGGTTMPLRADLSQKSMFEGEEQVLSLSCQSTRHNAGPAAQFQIRYDPTQKSRCLENTVVNVTCSSHKIEDIHVRTSVRVLQNHEAVLLVDLTIHI
jgi:hypothetical protein